MAQDSPHIPSAAGGRSVAAVGAAGSSQRSPAGAAERRAGRAHLQGVRQAVESGSAAPKASLPLRGSDSKAAPPGGPHAFNSRSAARCRSGRLQGLPAPLSALIHSYPPLVSTRVPLPLFSAMRFPVPATAPGDIGTLGHSIPGSPEEAGWLQAQHGGETFRVCCHAQGQAGTPALACPDPCHHHCQGVMCWGRAVGVQVPQPCKGLYLLLPTGAW